MQSLYTGDTLISFSTEIIFFHYLDVHRWSSPTQYRKAPAELRRGKTGWRFGIAIEITTARWVWLEICRYCSFSLEKVVVQTWCSTHSKNCTIPAVNLSSPSIEALCNHQGHVWDTILQWVICMSSKQVLQVQGGAWSNSQRGNTQKLLITPCGTTTEPGQTWVTVLRMLPKHTVFKDEAQVESEVKFITTLALPATPCNSWLPGKWERHGVTEQRWHFVTQGNGLAMLTALWGFTLPWGLSLQENWEKSLQPKCTSRAVSGELASSITENSTTAGQMRAAIFSRHTKPSPPLSSPAIGHSGMILWVWLVNFRNSVPKVCSSPVNRSDSVFGNKRRCCSCAFLTNPCSMVCTTNRDRLLVIKNNKLTNDISLHGEWNPWHTRWAVLSLISPASPLNIDNTLRGVQRLVPINTNA